MIWPPFTIFILKNNRRPVTIRVTGPVFALMTILVPVVFCAAGFGLSRLLPGGNGGLASSPSLTTAQTSGNTATPGKAVPDLGGVFISRAASGEIEVSFTPANLPADGVCHVWIIANPGDDHGTVFIHPRSPLFRGLPVDYRNGEEFMPADGKKVTIAVGDIPGNIALEEVRILIYSSEGTVLIDERIPIDH